MACSILCSVLVVVTAVVIGTARGSGDHLTAGFTRVRLTESQFVVQKPYNVPLDARYEFAGGVRRMWVFSTDKPGSATHPGGARTEIKINVCRRPMHAGISRSISRSHVAYINSFVDPWSMHAGGVHVGGVAVRG